MPAVQPTTARDLAPRLNKARAHTDELFALLQPDALYERPIPERHRLVFYLGHLEAFDGNLFRQAYGLEPAHPEFDKLFAFGIDPTDGGLPNEPASAWPRPEPIRDYNDRVRASVDSCLVGRHAIRPELDEATIVNMAIEHRLMHAETLAYLLHQLPFASKRSAPDAPATRPSTGSTGGTVPIPAGAATLGRSRSAGFGWDNEFDEHRASVDAFIIDVHKVTNGRFLEFLRAGGYDERRLWSDIDWAWKERIGLRHPGFWIERDGAFDYHGMHAIAPLPLDVPVYVSHAEASAFARWVGGALPTEAQFHRAAYGTPGGGERAYPWGDEAPAREHGNFDFHRWDPTLVGAHPAGASAFGVQELVGNGWEWTSTLFAPFEGFRAHPLYPGYSADFFDGKHYVMKGGSPRTAACMLRRSFRNWFQPRYPYVYGTFRLVGA